jgi:hypothetical protein
LWGQGGERTQALYAHMNNKKIKIKKILITISFSHLISAHKAKQKPALVLGRHSAESAAWGLSSWSCLVTLRISRTVVIERIIKVTVAGVQETGVTLKLQAYQIHSGVTYFICKQVHAMCSLYCDPIRRHTHCPWASAPHHHPGHRAL